MDIQKTESLQQIDTRTNVLGSLRLRHEETNEIILIPAPTDDPNDPLNW
jgi:hypothetical protein